MNFVTKEPINKGWSSDKKYCVTDENGTRYLLRVSDIAQHDTKQPEFNMMKQVASFGVPMCQPIECRDTRGGRVKCNTRKDRTVERPSYFRIKKSSFMYTLLFTKGIFEGYCSHLPCRDARGARKEKINSIFVSHNIDRAAEIIQKSLGFLYRQEKQTRHRFSPSPSGGGFNVYDLTIIKSPMPEISKAAAAPVILFANAFCALPNA